MPIQMRIADGTTINKIDDINENENMKYMEVAEIKQKTQENVEGTCVQTTVVGANQHQFFTIQDKKANTSKYKK